MFQRDGSTARAMRDNGLGRVEYVVETLRPGARQTWLVMSTDIAGARSEAQKLRRTLVLMTSPLNGSTSIFTRWPCASVASIS